MTPAPQDTARTISVRAPLLRLGLPRDQQATTHLGTFLVTAMLTVLVTRALLAATGYPQLGGGGLHIAHVLWGGLLLTLAFFAVLSFVGPAVRPLAALVGGVGFGLFIDEVGKFLTADNDYFYAPTASVVYASIVVLGLLVEVLHSLRTADPTESLANAVDEASAGVAGGLSPTARRRAYRYLTAAGTVPGTSQTAALLDSIGTDHEEVPDPAAAVRRWALGVLHRVVRARAVPWIAVAVFMVGSAASVGLGLTGSDGPRWLLVGVAGSGLTSFGLAAFGLWRMRTNQVDGYLWVRRGMLVGVLVTQFFNFRLSQWDASVGLIVNLLALGVVSVELDELRAHDSPGASVRTTPLSKE
ncbi:MAG: hypothetical protein KJ792_05965 [Actinobacteria bacterium]|nr:hypothetical protein [Actinomycetota bacterium]